jgi:hypothetical protein
MEQVISEDGNSGISGGSGRKLAGGQNFVTPPASTATSASAEQAGRAASSKATTVTTATTTTTTPETTGKASKKVNFWMFADDESDAQLTDEEEDLLSKQLVKFESTYREASTLSQLYTNLSFMPNVVPGHVCSSFI